MGITILEGLKELAKVVMHKAFRVAQLVVRCLY